MTQRSGSSASIHLKNELEYVGDGVRVVVVEDTNLDFTH